MNYPDKQDYKDILTALIFLSCIFLVSLAILHLTDSPRLR